jgi:hypothetical protein
MLMYAGLDNLLWNINFIRLLFLLSVFQHGSGNHNDEYFLFLFFKAISVFEFLIKFHSFDAVLFLAKDLAFPDVQHDLKFCQIWVDFLYFFPSNFVFLL